MLASYIIGFTFIAVLFVVGAQVLNFKRKKNTQIKPFKTISDSAVIDQAIHARGILTATSLAHGANISVSTAKDRLEELYQEGVFEMDVQESGVLSYQLRDRSLLQGS